MPEATDVQMQTFSDERVRRRAEQIRALLVACMDDQGSLDDVYQRAIGPNPWHDNRQDGPPHLLQSGGGLNPDDMLNYNTFVARFLDFMNGSLTNQNMNEAAASWQLLKDSCVRPIG